MADISAARKKAEAHIHDVIKTLDPSGHNTERYKTFFASMDDKAFVEYFKMVKAKKARLELIVPNGIVNIRASDIHAAADKVGIKLLERLRLWDPVAERYYVTPNEYLVVKVPVRRVKQFLMNKISIPEGDSKTDLLSGQVIKPDKGSSISLTEMQTMLSKGLEKSVTELMTVRGGNLPLYAEYKSRLLETGTISLSELTTNSTVRSAIITSVYLKGMMIENNFAEGM